MPRAVPKDSKPVCSCAEVNCIQVATVVSQKYTPFTFCLKTSVCIYPDISSLISWLLQLEGRIVVTQASQFFERTFLLAGAARAGNAAGSWISIGRACLCGSFGLTAYHCIHILFQRDLDICSFCKSGLHGSCIKNPSVVSLVALVSAWDNNMLPRKGRTLQSDPFLPFWAHQLLCETWESKRYWIVVSMPYVLERGGNR